MNFSVSGSDRRSKDQGSDIVKVALSWLDRGFRPCVIYPAGYPREAGPATGKSKAELCAAVVKCGQAAGCRGSVCFCGTASLVDCLLGMGNGPCKTEIFAAAEISPLSIRPEVVCRFCTPGTENHARATPARRKNTRFR